MVVGWVKPHIGPESAGLKALGSYRKTTDVPSSARIDAMLHKNHLNVSVLSRRFTSRPIVKASSMAEVKNITPLDAKQLKTKIIDVRTASEFAAGHAPGAVNIPFLLEIPAEGKPKVPNTEFLATFSSEFPDKGETLVLTCQKGGRGTNAVLSLQAEGYENLLNIGTGMGGWAEENLPLEK